MNLSDAARSILVFAAYHELTSGEPVKESASMMALAIRPVLPVKRSWRKQG